MAISNVKDSFTKCAPRRPHRGPFWDCGSHRIGFCDIIPSAWGSHPGLMEVQEDSDALTAGKYADFVRAVEQVQSYGVRQNIEARQAVDASGDVLLAPFGSTTSTATAPAHYAFAGVELAISGRLADIQSAELSIVTDITWRVPNLPIGVVDGPMVNPGRNLKLRLSAISADVTYLYIPTLKKIILGVEEQQATIAYPRVTAADGAILPYEIAIAGFTGAGLSVKATMVVPHSAEMLRMTTALNIGYGSADVLCAAARRRAGAAEIRPTSAGSPLAPDLLPLAGCARLKRSALPKKGAG